MDNMDLDNMMNGTDNGMDGMDDLDAMFGSIDDELQKNEKIVLSQNLEGFAACFPDWDLHPPV